MSEKGTGMNTQNVSDMPTDWWAWTGDELIPLGICEDFDGADERASKIGKLAHWIFSRVSLTTFVEQARKELE